LTAASQTAHSGDGGEGRRRRGEQTWASSSSSGGCCTHLSKSRGNASSSGGTLLVALASDVALTAPPARLRGPTRRICSLAHPVPALPLPSRRRPTLTAPHRVHSTPTRPAVETARCRTPGGGATDALTPRALSCAVPAMPAIPLRPTKVRLVVLGPEAKTIARPMAPCPLPYPMRFDAAFDFIQSLGTHYLLSPHHRASELSRSWTPARPLRRVLQAGRIHACLNAVGMTASAGERRSGPGWRKTPRRVWTTCSGSAGNQRASSPPVAPDSLAAALARSLYSASGGTRGQRSCTAVVQGLGWVVAVQVYDGGGGRLADSSKWPEGI
jgi:hypothetical protein